MGDKNCMFQYATRHRIYADTDLITKDDALALFNKNKQDFTDRIGSGDEAQMCIWINCKDSDSYGETLYDWCQDDFKVIDGDLYQRV